MKKIKIFDYPNESQINYWLENEKPYIESMVGADNKLIFLYEEYTELPEMLDDYDDMDMLDPDMVEEDEDEEIEEDENEDDDLPPRGVPYQYNLRSHPEDRLLDPLTSALRDL